MSAGAGAGPICPHDSAAAHPLCGTLSSIHGGTHGCCLPIPGHPLTQPGLEEPVEEFVLGSNESCETEHRRTRSYFGTLGDSLVAAIGCEFGHRRHLQAMAMGTHRLVSPTSPHAHILGYLRPSEWGGGCQGGRGGGPAAMGTPTRGSHDGTVPLSCPHPAVLPPCSVPAPLGTHVGTRLAVPRAASNLGDVFVPKVMDGLGVTFPCQRCVPSVTHPCATVTYLYGHPHVPAVTPRVSLPCPHCHSR